MTTKRRPTKQVNAPKTMEAIYARIYKSMWSARG